MVLLFDFLAFLIFFFETCAGMVSFDCFDFFHSTASDRRFTPSSSVRHSPPNCLAIFCFDVFCLTAALQTLS